MGVGVAAAAVAFEAASFGALVAGFSDEWTIDFGFADRTGAIARSPRLNERRAGFGIRDPKFVKDPVAVAAFVGEEHWAAELDDRTVAGWIEQGLAPAASRCLHVDQAYTFGITVV